MSEEKGYVFHTEEFEVALPENVRKQTHTPLFLTLGPAFTMIIPIVMMAIFGNLIYGSGGSNFIYMTLITGGTSALMGVIFALSNHIYRNRSEKEEVKRACDDYEEYLKNTETYLEKCRSDNRQFLLQRYPSTKEFLRDVSEEKLFKRYFRDENFLTVRLKSGQLPFQMKVRLSGSQNDIRKSHELQNAEKLVEKFSVIDDVPVTVNLKEVRHFGIERESGLESVLNLVIQIAFFCAPSKVKICVIYDRRDCRMQKALTCIKFLPHLWVDGGKCSLMAGSSEELSVLIPLLNLKLEEKKKHFVFLILSSEQLREETFFSRLTSGDENENCSVVFFEDLEHMPEVVHCVADKDIESVSFEQADSFGRKIASFNLLEEEKNMEIPEKVDFSELFRVERLEDIPIKEYWKDNHPNLRLRVPLGKTSPERILYLDIHESFHGPHGLIAGTTGSGKSELIVTYLVSLCVSFNPQDVNFFLIDYKGGGTGKYIDRLPHCAGSISNLSGESIGRALKAIRAENLRRQKLLDSAMVNHVDVYQELFRNGQVEEPMPHLVIVIDEFAELKKEEPEFMKEIISLSAVGRSLGIHLILATQKPAGVVDDKIWSNSHFKLCLKVQDRQDSMDMLHRGEAALLYTPGRCYMQIGNNEFFEQFQTGYLGGMCSSRVDKPAVFLVERTGKRRTLPGEQNPSENEVLKLEAAVSYVNQAACNLQYPRARLLWMEELPDQIVMEKEEGRLLLGMYDDPTRRLRGVMEYIPEKDGNLAIGGGPKSGKTTILKGLISQINEPDMFLALDIRGDGICELKKRTNCLGVLEDEEGISVFFYHLKRELKRRKKEYSERLYVFIDNFPMLLKTLNDEEQAILNLLLREGISLGIFAVITGGTPAEIGNRLLESFKSVMALEMNDVLMYGDMMRKYKLDVKPKRVPGRCLWREGDEIFEGQAAMFKVEPCPAGNNKYAFPQIPREITVNRLISETVRDLIPIGYSLKSGYIRGMNIGCNSFLIVGTENSGRHTLLNNIKECLEALIQLLPEEILSIQSTCVKLERLQKVHFLLIDDMGEFLRQLECEDYSEERKYLEKAVLYENDLTLIGIVNPQKDRDILVNSIMSRMTAQNCGVVLGGGAFAQRFLDCSDLSYSEGNAKLPRGLGYLRTAGCDKTILIKIPMERKEEDDDFD